MKNALSVCLIVLVQVAFLFGVSGCASELSDKDVRTLATKHRDDWVKASPAPENQVFAQTKIFSVEKVKDGWVMIFHLKTGGGAGAEEGMRIYNLEIKMDKKGKLQKATPSFGIS